MNQLSSTRRWLAPSVVASALIAVLTCWYLPAELLLGNRTDFDADRTALGATLATYALVAWVVLLSPLVVPNQRWRNGYSIGLLAWSILLWVSGTLVVNDIGALAGDQFQLSDHASAMTVQSVGLTGLLVLLVIAAHRWQSPLTGLGLILAVGLASYAGIMLYREAPTNTQQRTATAKSALFHFSTDKNLLIVLMDTFQSDVFDTIIDSNPKLRASLDGFTYFPDTLGVAPSTYLTMPAFHSGRRYEYGTVLRDYYTDTVKHGSFLTQFAEAGYRVELVNPIANVCPAGVLCLPQSAIVSNSAATVRQEAAWLLDLALFRVLPGWLKSGFDGFSGSFSKTIGNPRPKGEMGKVLDSDRLLVRYVDELSTGSSQPTARLVHLFNTHPPFVLNAGCRFTGHTIANNRRLMQPQAECALRRFQQLLAALRRAGVYDNTIVVLVADTGAGLPTTNLDLANRFATERGMDPNGLPMIMAGANPLLAIKPLNASGALIRDQRSAQLTDIAQTVCELTGDCEIANGVSLFAAGPVASKRLRRFNYYRWKTDFWTVKTIPGLQGFDVNGPLWEAQSWQRILTGEPEAPIWEVTFSATDPPHWFGFGWGRPEVHPERGTTKRWATAASSELILPLQSDQDLLFTFDVFRAPMLAKQTISASLNGYDLGQHSIGEHSDQIAFRAPRSTVRAQLNELTLKFSDLQPQQQVDRRSLAVSFSELRISPID